MKNNSFCLIYVFLFLFLGIEQGTAQNEKMIWNQLFGPNGNGIALESEESVPLNWSETENIQWKLELRGRGHSSPIYANDELWLTESSEDGTILTVLAVDVHFGKIVKTYSREITEPSKFSRNENTYATPTPIFENNRLYVYFGDAGVLCLNTEDATLVWERPDIRYNFDIGAGSSPILWNDLLILNVDSIEEGNQFVIALDKQSGETVWKTQRSYDLTNIYWDTKKAFSTNRVVRYQDTEYLLSLGAQAAYAYDPGTGKELWRFDYPGGFSNTISPFAYNGLAFVHDGFGKNILYAVDITSRGLISDDKIVWSVDKNLPRVANPLLIGRVIYLAGENGMFSCLNAETGETLWKKRVGGKYWAAPLYQNGRIFFWDCQEGKTVVIAADSEKCVILANNQLESGCIATPVLLGKTLFMRTTKALYCIESNP